MLTVSGTLPNTTNPIDQEKNNTQMVRFLKYNVEICTNLNFVYVHVEF